MSQLHAADTWAWGLLLPTRLLAFTSLGGSPFPSLCACPMLGLAPSLRGVLVEVSATLRLRRGLPPPAARGAFWEVVRETCPVRSPAASSESPSGAATPLAGPLATLPRRPWGHRAVPWRCGVAATTPFATVAAAVPQVGHAAATASLRNVGSSRPRGPSRATAAPVEPVLMAETPRS